MAKDWHKNPVIVPIALVLIGIFLFVAEVFIVPKISILKDADLVETEFYLRGKNFSILAPKGALKIEQENPHMVIFKKSAGIRGVSVILIDDDQKKELLPSASAINCKNLEELSVFTVHISGLNQDIEICESPGASLVAEFKGYKFLSSVPFIYEGIYYMIGVIVSDNYFAVPEGTQKTRNIFESFTIKP